MAELGPDADPFTPHVYAALAERRRRMVPERTRVTLDARRARDASSMARIVTTPVAARLL